MQNVGLYSVIVPLKRSAHMQYNRNKSFLQELFLHCSGIANDWLLGKAGVSRNLLESVKARNLTYFGHIMRKKSERLEKQIMQGTTPGFHTRGRQRTTWTDNIL